MKTILTPVDFSTATAGVIAASVELASALDAEIVLLHVVQPPMVTSDYGLALENVQEIIAVSEKAADRQLGHLTTQLQETGVKARALHVNGTAVPSILEQAEAAAASYIVLGSHGHTAFYELLVGSTTHGVLKKAPCPVIVVPPSKK
tara:strand:+ start:29 stop:469 length:441 start_codon:yes stop_codon:yes gene_type:complete